LCGGGSENIVSPTVITIVLECPLLTSLWTTKFNDDIIIIIIIIIIDDYCRRRVRIILNTTFAEDITAAPAIELRSNHVGPRRWGRPTSRWRARNYRPYGNDEISRTPVNGIKYIIFVFDRHLKKNYYNYNTLTNKSRDTIWEICRFRSTTMSLLYLSSFIIYLLVYIRPIRNTARPQNIADTRSLGHRNFVRCSGLVWSS